MNRPSNRQALMALAAATILAGGGYWLGAGSARPPAPPEANDGGTAPDDNHAEGEIAVTPAQIAAAGITLARVALAPAGGEVLATGRIVPNPDGAGHVTARTNGVVTRLLAQIGTRVTAGQGLAVIDSQEAATAQAALATARSRLALADKTFAREQRLLAQRVTARADFEQAEAALAAARIEARAAEQGLAALGMTPGGSRLFTLKSPVAGEVTTVSVTPGEYVTPDRELFQVVDRRAIWAELQVPARDLVGIAAGLPVEVTVQGADHPHQATLKFVSPSVDNLSGTLRAIAVVRDPDGELRQGQSLTARILTPAGRMAPTVPHAAVQDVGGRPVVFVRTARGFTLRPVTLGAARAETVAVLAGLQPGDSIAATNSFVLKAELGKGEAEHD
jgi:cobalt-zinc-cadmium efflux system membrane fusion protein